MKNPIFKIEFLQEEIIVEMWEMAHSIRLEKLFYSRHKKSFAFLVVDYLNRVNVLKTCKMWYLLTNCGP